VSEVFISEKVFLVGVKNSDGSYTVVKEMKKVRRAKKENFYMGDQGAAVDLALEEGLSKMDYRLLLYFLGNMDWDNNVIASQSFLAETFLTQHSYISKSINNLVSKGLITKGKLKGQTCFHVEEHVAVKGQRDDSN
jgi:hypothetical protein